MDVEGGGQHLVLFLRNRTSWFFFKQGLSLVWSLLSGLDWLTRHLLVSTSPIRQLQVYTTMGDFFMWGQASHSEPCACQISALLVALFP